jgi:PAS domain S-box-containing protein
LDAGCKIFRKIRDVRVAMDMQLDPTKKLMTVTGISRASHRMTVSLDRQLVHDYDVLLGQYMPPGVLVDEQRHVLHCFGDISELLQQPRGRFENDLLEMVPDALKIPLSTALHRAAQNCAMVTSPNAVWLGEEEKQCHDLRVECLHDSKTSSMHYFVSLSPTQRERPNPARTSREVCDIPRDQIPEYLQQRIVELEEELEVNQENLQTSIEELQTANEELQTTNEELMASNEELQSTNEELQSVNEELYTVNAEFELKNRELKQLNQDHENLLGSIEVGIVYLDRDLRIRKFNPAIEKIFNLLPQDIGRPIDHIAYHLSRQEDMLKDVRLVLATGRIVENEVITQEGHWLLKRLLPFRNENRVVEGVVMTFTDISRVKEAERKLAQANEELERKVAERTEMLLLAKDEADSANAAKSLFLANMSHEIRTPMTGIFATVQLFEASTLSPRQREFLHVLKTSAGNLMEILDDILDFSKIEAGKLALKRETFTLADVIEEVLSLYRPRFVEKKLECVTDLGKDVPPELAGDPLRLKQVFSNLFSNAVKFTDQGQIVLVAAVQESGEESVLLRFSIRDTGCGLTPETLDLIFQPFAQADPSITRRYGGTGLGLTICKKLVTMMEGEIWAENNPEGGASFHFTVRLGLPDRAAEVPRGGQTDSRPVRDFGFYGLKILVAEDDPLNRYLLTTILQDMGCNPVAVENGAEALRRLENETFDLVLMDISMPEMDGITATRNIRRYSEKSLNHHVPIIAVTAHVLDESREKFIGAGFSDVVTKPYSISELQRVIDRFNPRQGTLQPWAQADPS